jgi:glycerol uptake facilitator-like aquaporin
METKEIRDSKGVLKIVSGKVRSRIIVLNIAAEFIASILFSVLYFIFISRYISSEFHLDYITLCFGVGLAYFAAVYIPFHTYRIHVIPFITIISVMRKKQLKFIWYKIPAQILGAYIGALIFSLINAETTQVSVYNLQKISFTDPWLLAFVNFITAGILCYGFFIIRVFFKKRKISGTIFMGLLISAIFAIVGLMNGVSAINPFGLLFYDLLNDKTLFNHNWVYSFFIHIVAPLAATILVYYRLKYSLKESSQTDKIFKLNERVMKNYDI